MQTDSHIHLLPQINEKNLIKKFSIAMEIIFDSL